MFRDINRNAARVRSRTALDDPFGGIERVGVARGPRLARDSGIKFAVRRFHREVVHGSLRHAFLHRRLGRRFVGGAEDEVAIHRCGRIFGIRQFFRHDITGRVGIARRRSRAARPRGGSLGGCYADREEEHDNRRTDHAAPLSLRVLLLP